MSNFARFALSLVIAFFLTPFVVRSLGDSIYGFWITVMAFFGYAGILEMGVQPAVVKLVGQYRAVGDWRKLEELLNTALVYFGAAALFAAIFCLTVVPRIVFRHVHDLDVLAGMTWLFPLIAVDAMTVFFNYLVSGILYGAQRYPLRNSIDMVGWIVNAALVIWLLPRHGLMALISARVLTNTLIVTVSAFAAMRTLSEVRLRPGAVSRDSFRQLVSFGGRVFLSATTTRLANHSQPIIISTALSSAATATYAIPVKLMDYSRQLAWALTASLMPMFSELESRNERELLRQLYLDYSRYFLLLLMPIVALLFVYGGPFIGLWIGPQYQERGGTVILLLAGGVLADSMQPLLWRFFIGIGRLDSLVRISAISSILVILAAALLVRPIGLSGVAGAVLTGSAVAQLLYAVDTCRYFELSLWKFFTRIQLRPLLAGGLLYVVARLAAGRIGSGSYLAMLAGAGLSLLPYAFLALFLGLDGDERNSLFRRLRRRAQGA